MSAPRLPACGDCRYYQRYHRRCHAFGGYNANSEREQTGRCGPDGLAFQPRRAVVEITVIALILGWACGLGLVIADWIAAPAWPWWVTTVGPGLAGSLVSFTVVTAGLRR